MPLPTRYKLFGQENALVADPLGDFVTTKDYQLLAECLLDLYRVCPATAIPGKLSIRIRDIFTLDTFK